jgi:hypothetical protein
LTHLPVRGYSWWRDLGTKRWTTWINWGEGSWCRPVHPLSEEEALFLHEWARVSGDEKVVSIIKMVLELGGSNLMLLLKAVRTHIEYLSEEAEHTKNESRERQWAGCHACEHEGTKSEKWVVPCNLLI